jgi:hypothetical protein
MRQPVRRRAGGLIGHDGGARGEAVGATKRYNCCDSYPHSHFSTPDLDRIDTQKFQRLSAGIDVRTPLSDRFR